MLDADLSFRDRNRETINRRETLYLILSTVDAAIAVLYAAPYRSTISHRTRTPAMQTFRYGLASPAADLAPPCSPTTPIPRAYESGKTPDDSSAWQAARSTTASFSLTVPKPNTIRGQVRRQQIREQVLVADGLWPLPEKTPLNAVIHGKIDRDDYTIEKVFFASYPGPLRQRQPLSAQGQDGQAARRPLSARPLGRRPFLRRRREGRPEA